MNKLLPLFFLVLLVPCVEAMPYPVNPGRHDRLHHRAGNRWGKYRPTRCRYCRQNLAFCATENAT